jgi:hypothetical protein
MGEVNAEEEILMDAFLLFVMIPTLGYAIYATREYKLLERSREYCKREWEKRRL